MSYYTKSNQHGDLSEQIVIADLVQKGWVPCTPISRDTVYDLIVDRGNVDGKRIFETIQVKTLARTAPDLCEGDKKAGMINQRLAGHWSHPWARAPSMTKAIRMMSKTASNVVKTRDISYNELGIDWIAGVDIHNGTTHYWHIDVYSKIPSKQFSIVKYGWSDFPVNNDVNNHMDMVNSATVGEDEFANSKKLHDGNFVSRKESTAFGVNAYHHKKRQELTNTQKNVGVKMKKSNLLDFCHDT